MQSVNGFDSPSDALAYIHSPVLQGLERVKISLRDMVNHKSPFLAQLLDHALETKGKRVRPTLTLLAAGFHPNDGKRAETMATAVELLHIASLIHDDTVDQSEVRRGRATISKLWGGNAAVVLGDYLFATSATYVCDTGNIRVIRRFAETIKELSSGEMEEMVVRYDAEPVTRTVLHPHLREDRLAVYHGDRVRGRPERRAGVDGQAAAGLRLLARHGVPDRG